VRVLLIHPADFPDPERPPPVLPPNQAPPLGLAYIAAWLRETGHEPAILDMRHAEPDRPAFAACVRDFAPRLIGIGLYTVTVPVAGEIARIAKEQVPGCRIVVGGPHPAGAPEECARHPDFDFAAVGEGEVMMQELADVLERGGELRSVAGLHYTADPTDPDSELIVNEPRGWIDDLDSLPWPARDLLPPLDSYRMTMFQYRKWPATTLYTSRGCPYGCIFCERREILGTKFRVHSPEHVVDEIEHLVQDWGMKEVFFYDDTFTLDGRRATRIAEEMLRRDVRISWNISTHVRNVDRDLLALMRRAGCWQIAYGIETGDDRVMAEIGKGTDLATVRERVGWTVEAGLEAKGLFMIGHPTDTPESIERTIDFACSLPIASANFKITTPFVGTPLRDMADDYGQLAGDDYRNFMGDPDQAVFVPNALTRDYLMGVQKRAYRRFYSRPSRLVRLARSMAGREHIDKWWAGAKAFAGLLRERPAHDAPGVIQQLVEVEH